MVRKLVRNRKSYLLLRGRTYYFRYSTPSQARALCPLLPIEVKRSLYICDPVIAAEDIFL